MEKHFFLFRHGETTYNVNGFIQGQTNDSVLTKKGQEQAFNVGKLLKTYPLDVLISSPLTRALQTSEQVLKHFSNLPFKIDERFTEVNVGEIEGLHHTIVQEKFKEKYTKWHSQDRIYQDIKFTGGESKNDVRKRVFSALTEYANNPQYKYIAISGHGILLTQTLLAIGLCIDNIKNGSILHLIYKNKQWSFEKLIED